MLMLKNRKAKTFLAIGVLSALTSQALADNKDILGTVIGAAIGGALGSNVGKGNGKTVATIAGAVIGGVIGHEIGEALDERDRLAAENAYLRSLEGPINQPTRWDGHESGSSSGNSGTFQSTREFRSSEGYHCRSYVSETYVNGRYHRKEGSACRYPDGSWRSYESETVSDNGTQPPVYTPAPPVYTPPRHSYGPTCRILGQGSHRGMIWNYRIAVDGTIWEASDSFSSILYKMQQLESARICTRDPGGVCELSGHGSYRGMIWNFRMSLNGETVEASDSFESILSRMNQYQTNGLCRQATPKECSISGRGSYRGLTWNYRVNLNGSPIQATDNFSSLQNIVRRLQDANVCFVQPRERCQLMPGGSYRGLRWNYLINIGYETVDASDYFNSAVSRMEEMRRSGFCY